MRIALGIVIAGLLLALASTTSRRFAEVPNRSPEQLKQMSTHIVTGEVMNVYQRSEHKGAVRYERRLAEVRVRALEHGDASGIEAGSLIYVRYFTKHNPPGVTDTAGHRGLPVEGESIRIHLARNASDGYHRPADNNDGGFNVVFPNGFEKLKK